MILFTVKGRIQTKLLTYLILAAVTLIFYGVTGRPEYGDLLVVAMLVGLCLEVLWGFLIPYQPGWVTLVLALVEFIGIAVVARRLAIPISFQEAVAYYLVSWVMIEFFLLYILPVFRLSWSEDGGELW